MKEGVILSVLAQKTPRELILHLINGPGSSQEELAGALAISPPSVSWNLKRLIDLGLVRKDQSGRFASYSVVGDLSEIAGFVRSYHPGVWERWSSRLADVVMAMSDDGAGNYS